MRRRNFLATATGLAAGVATPLAALAQQEKSERPGGRGGERRECYEIQTYTFATPEKQKAFAEFAGKAFVPALTRAGVATVGLFEPITDDTGKKPDEPMLFLVLRHAGLRGVTALQRKLSEDTALTEAGKGILDAPQKDPAFKSLDTALLVAFKGMPELVAPADKSDKRVYEIRIYQSHSLAKAQKKIDMFNDGEIAIFQSKGPKPVFYGERVAGSLMPCLTYMISSESMEAHKAAWGQFGGSPEWKKMNGDPQYADTVSNIIKYYLRALPGSQF
ncbi:MAG TPA: NIPSNAP family protein [Candidatus Sumerlaeota bacterium]|nr:NIPSNAP family protein [Candidatus Sumerlaeota bacterium]